MRNTLFTFILVFVSYLSLGNDTDSTFTEKDTTKSTILSFLFSGKSFDHKRSTLYIPAATQLLNYNTVEGLAVNAGVTYIKKLDKSRLYTIKPQFRYGIGNRKFHSKMNVNYYYNATRHSFVSASAGRYIQQINSESLYTALTNTIYTLMAKENYFKIYQQYFLHLSHHISPKEYFSIYTSVRWENRIALNNLDQFNNKTYSLNAPNNVYLSTTDFKKNRLFQIQTKLTWQRNYNQIWYRGKFKSTSKHPIFSIHYKGAFPSILGSSVAFHKLDLSYTQSLLFKKNGVGNLFINMGGFLNTRNLSFIDFYHFNGGRTVYSSFEPQRFQLLDYYFYSTSKPYLQLHYAHYLQPFKRRAALLILSTNYLYSYDTRNYIEFGVGVKRILKFWRMDIFTSIKKERYQQTGLRFAFIFE